MKTETYLNAYFAVRDRLEFVRLNGRTRARLVRQERKLEVRLRELLATWRAELEECNRERVFLWTVVIFQLAFLVGLAIAKVLG